jgi:hypothetical protein
MDKRSLKQGVLILALGHPNYLKMAAVLAASIRINNPSLAIALATNSTAIPQEYMSLFDICLPIEEDFYRVNGIAEFIKAKLHVYDITPFTETIFLDADQVMIPGRDLAKVFDELAAIDITFSNTGPSETSIWADIKEVQQLYGNKPFWNYHSEFVYFKKCAAAKKYFNAAIKVYKDNKIKSAKRFANATMADELAFQAAAIVTGIYPHKQNWLPNFWFDRDQRNSRKYPYELTDYITYSIGGNIVPQVVKNNYNILAKSYFAKLGLSNPYQVEDKRNFLPERKNV